jgi:hypothetical protein
MQRRHAFIDDLLMWHVARGDRQVGISIGRLALADQPGDGRLGVRGLQQRTVGTAPDPPHDHVGIRLEPNRHRFVMDPAARLFTHERTATGGKHRWSAFQKPRNHPRLAISEM